MARNVQNWNDSSVFAPTTEVRIAGQSVDHSDVSIVRSLPRTFTETATGFGGITAATGKISSQLPASVTGYRRNPWSQNQIGPGANVEVLAGRDGQNVKIFDGIVDTTSGEFSSDQSSVDFVDRIDQLNRLVQFPALLTTMPPREDNVFQWRQIGLCSTYFTDRILRKCDFFATPPMETGCVLSAPMMGSTWPERGEVVTSRKKTASWYFGPNFGGTVSGVGLWDVYAEWVPSSYEKTLRWNTFQITAAPDRSVAPSLWSMFGVKWNSENNGIQVAVTPGSRKLKVETIASGTKTDRGTHSPTKTDWDTVTLRVNPIDGSYLLRTNLGEVFGGSIGSSAPDSWAAASWVGFVDSPDRTVNSFQVSFPGGTAFQAVQTSPTAYLTPPATTAGPEIPELYASPRIVPTPAIDLLKDQAQAELAAMWIDEDGVFRWSNRRKLQAQPVSRTYTSENSLLDVSWSADSSATRRKVTVKTRQSAVQRSFWNSITAWEGSSKELRAGESHEVFIEPDDDTDWVELDTTLSVLGAGAQDDFNRGRDSWQGWHNLDSKGNWPSVTGTDVVASLATVGPALWRYRISVNSLPTGVDRIRLEARETDNLLSPPYRGQSLPLLRCRALTRWSDAFTESSFTGPKWATDLEHDASWWVQSESEIRNLADEIGKSLVKPAPVADSIKLVGDSRIQLGDKISVEDPVVTGVSLTGVVVEVRNSISPGDHTTEIRLLLTEVRVPTSLSTFDSDWAGKSLSSLDAYWSNSPLVAADSAAAAL